MPQVLPQIIALCEVSPSQTAFTRFIPAVRPGEGHGRLNRYYTRWADMTLERAGSGAVDLEAELRRFAPPAEIIDKPVYSPWLGSRLRNSLQARGCDTVLVSGGETEMFVLATVLGAVDWGYRTIIVSDGLCSASDEAHDAVVRLFSERYGQQVEMGELADILTLLPQRS